MNYKDLGFWGALGAVLAVMFLLGLISYAVSDESAASAAASPDLFVALAPFLAIATAIERFWELIFNQYEGFAAQMGRVIGVSAAKVRWIQNEVRKAEQAVKEIADQLPINQDAHNFPILWSKFESAEGRLLASQARLSELFKSPEYVSLKRSITLLGSLALGVAVAILSKLGLFNAAGYPIPPYMDIFLTGLIIGAGTGPMHSFIGFLQEFRNATTGLSELARGSAIQRVTVAQAITAHGAPAIPESASIVPKGILEDGEGSDAMRNDQLIGSNMNMARQARRILHFP